MRPASLALPLVAVGVVSAVGCLGPVNMSRGSVTASISTRDEVPVTGIARSSYPPRLSSAGPDYRLVFDLDSTVVPGLAHVVFSRVEAPTPGSYEVVPWGTLLTRSSGPVIRAAAHGPMLRQDAWVALDGRLDVLDARGTRLNARFSLTLARYQGTPNDTIRIVGHVQTH